MSWRRKILYLRGMGGFCLWECGQGGVIQESDNGTFYMIDRRIESDRGYRFEKGLFCELVPED